MLVAHHHTSHLRTIFYTQLDCLLHYFIKAVSAVSAEILLKLVPCSHSTADLINYSSLLVILTKVCVVGLLTCKFLSAGVLF